MAKISRTSTLSLRQRLLLGTLLITLPLLLISVIGYVMYVSALDTQEEMHHEITQELLPLIELKTLFLQAQMPANDYLIHADKTERENFQVLAARVNTVLKLLRETDIDLAHKRRNIDQATDIWRQAEGLSEQILALEQPVGNTQGAALMERMDELFKQGHDALAGAVNHGLGELADQHQQSHKWIPRIGVVLLAMFGFVVVFLIVGTLLLRNWIIAPLAEVQAGAARLGGGDLDYRLSVHSQDEIGRVAMAFNAMAGALKQEHETLHNLATHDALTGLLNVREFHRRLAQELERSSRAGHVLSVLMVDIDHFKAVNDRHGHPVGDKVIREIAVRMGDSLRPADIAGRYGGEEFIVLLPETDDRGAQALAERLRTYIHSRPLHVSTGVELLISVSIGVASYPRNAESLEDLVAGADHALYAAKAAGRNRVRMSDAEAPIPG